MNKKLLDFYQDQNLISSKFYKLFSQLPNPLIYILAFLGLIILSVVYPVQAHHPWDSNLGNFNLFKGFVSGMAHPVLGLDHFLFLFSIGFAGEILKRRWIPSLLGCGLFGAICAQFLPVLPHLEVIGGLSVLASLFVATGRLKPLTLIPLFAIHGYSLGMTFIGSETAPLFAYLIGLFLSGLFVIALGIFLFNKFNSYKRILMGIIICSGITYTCNYIFSTI